CPVYPSLEPVCRRMLSPSSHHRVCSWHCPRCLLAAGCCLHLRWCRCIPLHAVLGWWAACLIAQLVVYQAMAEFAAALAHTANPCLQAPKWPPELSRE